MTDLEPKYRAPKGTSDLVYPESEGVEALCSLASGILTRYGYRRIVTPVLESTELFRRGIGEETDIVTKEMYTFEDRGGESLTMRPEGTAPVIRAYLENSLAGEGLPQKLFYLGPMFRRERPQAGRFRQFLQVGAEVVGSPDPLADAEVTAVSDVLFRELGLTRYRLLVNSVGCRKCRPAYTMELKAFLEGVEGDLCEKCVKRAQVNPLRVFDCKEERCRTALSGAPTINEKLCVACREHLEGVLSHLRVLGVDFEVEGRLVRGLDYYTRTAFEYQFEGLGAQNTVCAGGRYDYLAETLGGPPTPGVGFSLGVERLVMALGAEGISYVDPPHLDVFVASAGDLEASRVLEITTMLRDAGLSADFDMMERSLKAQLRHADRQGSRLVVIAGKDELERGEVAVRDLSTSSQENVGLDSLVARIVKLL